MSISYWQKNNRFSRRRLLRSGGGAAATAFLIACGGGDESSNGTAPTVGAPTGSSGSTKGTGPTGTGSEGSGSTGSAPNPTGLLTNVSDETSSALRGGTIRKSQSGAWATLDPHERGTHTFSAGMLYSSLFSLKSGFLQPPSGEIVGDVIEAWEFSPDGSSMTMKIHPGAHFANLAPTDGRQVDAEDIEFSWNRFAQIGERRSDIVNAVNPTSPVISMTRIDAQTVVMNLSERLSNLLALLSSGATGSFFIVPKEAEDASVLDLRNTPRGSGMYQQTKNEESVGSTWERNPGFGQDDQPFIDAIENVVLGEYAAVLAQFRAGTFYDMGLIQEDILPTKGDIPELDLMVSPPVSSTHRVYFSQLPNSPFVDERVRQAYVLTWDRDLWLDTVYNLPAFEAEGIPVERFLEGALPNETWSGWYLDPLSADFGPNTMFFKQDLDEARKLLSAAGHSNGIDTTIRYLDALGAVWPQQNEIIMNMVRESGLFRFEVIPVDRATWYLPELPYQSSRGLAEGVVHVYDFATPDPVTSIFARYHSAGASFNGGDATLDEMIDRMIHEVDEETQISLIHEVQRYEGGKNYFPRLGGANQLSLTWPIIRNKFVYQGGTGRGNVLPHTHTFNFLDPSKAPN